jgi:26S proteasome regulatory subunit N2
MFSSHNEIIFSLATHTQIASAMILIQHTDQTCPKVSFFRQLYSQVISSKHEDTMAKFGAILAQGIIDAGGRNVTLGLQSRTGHTNLQAVVGMLVFTQYWYWFPMAHCLSLAFTPTCIIGLNSDLKMPKIEFKSSARPSLYAYPAPLEEKKREEREKVTTAVLSIAARQKRREGDKKKDESSKMEVDEEVKEEDGKKATPSAAATAVAVVADKKEKKSKDEKEGKADEGSTSVATPKEPKEPKERKEPEPTFEMLSNPLRVLRQQLKVISVAEGSPYQAIKDVTIGGIVMMQYTSQNEQVLVEPVAAYGPKSSDDAKEPDAPEPFEYIED